MHIREILHTYINVYRENEFKVVENLKALKIYKFMEEEFNIEENNIKKDKTLKQIMEESVFLNS